MFPALPGRPAPSSDMPASALGVSGDVAVSPQVIRSCCPFCFFFFSHVFGARLD